MPQSSKQSYTLSHSSNPTNIDIHPTSDLGEFPQPHEPRPSAMTIIPIAERCVACRIEPPITRKRKRDREEPSILHRQAHQRRESGPDPPEEETPTQPRLPDNHAPVPSTQPPPVTHPYPPDELDRLIHVASEHYRQSRTWTEFVTHLRGERSDLHHAVGSIDHPAAPLLEQLRVTGAGVEMKTDPWPKRRI